MRIWSHKQQHTLNRGKDCMTKFCESLREHAKSIIDFEKEEMLLLTKKKKKLKSHEDAENICGKYFIK